MGGRADLLLLVDGLNGESGDEEFPDAMRLSSWQLGMGRAVSTLIGGDRETSKTSVSEMTITCSMEKMVQEISILTLRGRARDVRLIQRRPGGVGISVTAIEIEMKNVLFTAISFASAEEMPRCTISLNFSEIACTYYPQDSAGLSQGGASWSWRADAGAD